MRKLSPEERFEISVHKHLAKMDIAQPHADKAGVIMATKKRARDERALLVAEKRKQRLAKMEADARADALYRANLQKAMDAELLAIKLLWVERAESRAHSLLKKHDNEIRLRAERLTNQ